VTGKTLQETIVWQDLTFDVGVDIRAQSEVSILRMVMSRQFRDKGPHSLRLVAGLHYFDASASLAGEAAIGGLGTEFREARASASGPLPNIGAWYRYSPSDRWLMSARFDWLSAKVGNIRGGFWNIAAGANYRLSEHVGVGLAYQLFELDGQLYEDRWRGQLKTRFSGPNLYISAFW